MAHHLNFIKRICKMKYLTCLKTLVPFPLRNLPRVLLNLAYVLMRDSTLLNLINIQTWGPSTINHMLRTPRIKIKSGMSTLLELVRSRWSKWETNRKLTTIEKEVRMNHFWVFRVIKWRQQNFSSSTSKGRKWQAWAYFKMQPSMSKVWLDAMSCTRLAKSNKTFP